MYVTLYQNIRDFLVSNGWKISVDEGGSFFTRDFEVSTAKMVYINGQPAAPPTRSIEVAIEYLGVGAIIDSNGPEVELQGFKMANNDIWVDSLGDFEFWYNQIFRQQ